MVQSKSNGASQLEDIANALGVSKSTVSRAISGNGRVGKETRERILDYIAKNDYHPNGIARSLARSKTDNIGVVIPADVLTNESSFFQGCLMGACESAVLRNYDVLVTSVSEDNISALRRIIANKKVDGIILTRSHTVDKAAEYLAQVGMPVVLVGTTGIEGIVQIDADMEASSRLLSSAVIESGKKRPALLIGSESFVVNRDRKKGFLLAHSDAGLPDSEELIFPVCEKDVAIAVEKAIARRADAIIAGDDGICTKILAHVREQGYNISISSLYNSDLLRKEPLDYVIDIDVNQLGRAAGDTLIDLIENGTVSKRAFFGYRLLRGGNK